MLEYRVLALPRDGPRYAVEPLRGLEAGELMATSQGTVHPPPSRLRRDDLVAATWQQPTSGPPRRSYEPTPAGRAALAEFVADTWPRFRDGVGAGAGVDHFLATPTSPHESPEEAA